MTDVIGKDTGATSHAADFRNARRRRPASSTRSPEEGDTVLTTQQGAPVADDQNTLKVGERGAALLEDFHFREKIFHFDHERIPERVVHARGYGVHGTFTLKESLADHPVAKMLTEVGEQTPMFVRFSTVVGNKGSFDLARDVRGFASKFYTKEGNWDIVANNIPVFFIQDAIKFPDLIHAAKPAPDREFPQAQTAHDNFWDFITLTPESMHMIMWVHVRPGDPPLLPLHGRLRRPQLPADQRRGQEHLRQVPLQAEAGPPISDVERGGEDQRRRSGLPPPRPVGRHRPGCAAEWDLGVQLFDDDFADQFEFDILDATKIIPEEQVPVRIIGSFVLDGLVDNFFAETEQVAFCTQNVVPGIGFTNDPLLQGRNFSYLDTQLKRLGSPNFTHIPINAPRCPCTISSRTATWPCAIPRAG
jgi:catalase